ncbi:hypothetical protein S83_047495, partial [Arachis hypogaea]
LVESLTAKIKMWEADKGIPFLYEKEPLLHSLCEYNVQRQLREEEKMKNPGITLCPLNLYFHFLSWKTTSKLDSQKSGAHGGTRWLLWPTLATELLPLISEAMDFLSSHLNLRTKPCLIFIDKILGRLDALNIPKFILFSNYFGNCHAATNYS